MVKTFQKFMMRKSNSLVVVSYYYLHAVGHTTECLMLTSLTLESEPLLHQRNYTYDVQFLLILATRKLFNLASTKIEQLNFEIQDY